MMFVHSAAEWGHPSDNLCATLFACAFAGAFWANCYIVNYAADPFLRWLTGSRAPMSRTAKLP